MSSQTRRDPGFPLRAPPAGERTPATANIQMNAGSGTSLSGVTSLKPLPMICLLLKAITLRSLSIVNQILPGDPYSPMFGMLRAGPLTKFLRPRISLDT
jgi:hypothetical protein